MTEPEEALARIESLLQIALRLAMSTASGRIVLAKAAANVDPAWIPDALAPSLGRALAEAGAVVPAPLDGAEVEAILTGAWGVRRLSDVLDSFDPDPIAVRLTSQVHRAVHDGAPVAVKVLRPGIATAMRQDLSLLDALIAPLAGAFPGLEPRALLSEARERIMDEFDLENEAQLMRRFHRALRHGPVLAPAPVGELCGESVLVAAWLEGTSVAASASDVPDPDATAAALVHFVIGGLREGLVHCDIDADDVLILADGRLGVVDFGAAAVIERGRADLALAVVDAYAAEDASALDGALAALGVLAPGHGATALALASSALGELRAAAPSRLDTAAVAAALRRLEGHEREAVELLGAARLHPADLYPVRGIAQLLSLVARLGATGTWRDQVRSALTAGWRG